MSDAEASKYLYCDGSTFSATNYPKLYQILGTTTLPDLRERFLEGFDTAGNYIEAGLPEIEGGLRSAYGGIQDAMQSDCSTNAFKCTQYNNYYAQTSNYIFGSAVSFKASRSNPLYGNSSTVQPSSYTVRYYIRAK